MKSPIGADVVVEVVLKYDRADWPRVTAELCGGDASLEGLVGRLLSHYDRPDAALPDGPYPVELGPFTLERELGAGAHGKVYLARRPPLDGYVALKLLRPGPGMSEFVEQVRREAGRARRIPSAHVVPVFDAGRVEGGPFYVEMAVCADPDEEAPGSIRIGRSLREAREGLAADEAARLVEDLARAVHAAHRTGVVHGDVKPENVLLTPESRRVMLADFGIATSLAQQASPGSTPIGTVAYMAPEQWRDRLPPSEASDVYTLGGTLYFLLSGQAPHAGRDEGTDPAPPPLPPRVPDRLREIVARALSPRPEDRPPSAGALAEELRRFRALEPTWHDRRSTARRLLLFSRRHLRELVAMAAVLAVVAPLVLLGYSVFTGRVEALDLRERELEGKIREKEDEQRRLQRETDATEAMLKAKQQENANMEGQLKAKQQELSRTEGKLKEVPKLKQELGAAQEEALLQKGNAQRWESDATTRRERVASLEAQLAEARAAEARAAAERSAALERAGRGAGELAEVKRQLDAARSQEREAGERAAALGASLAAAKASLERETARAGAAERERDALRARLPEKGSGGAPADKAPPRAGP